MRINEAELRTVIPLAGYVRLDRIEVLLNVKNLRRIMVFDFYEIQQCCFNCRSYRAYLEVGNM